MLCGPFDFMINLVDLFRKRKFKDFKGISAKNVRDLLDNAGGMKIYYDNFRIQSYGDKKKVCC